MTYDEMIICLRDLNVQQNLSQAATPHCNNLLFQLGKKDERRKALFDQIIDKYVSLRSVIFDEDNLGQYINDFTTQANNYMNMFWPPANNSFSHQADFTSSIVPEILCIVFKQIITNAGVDLEVSAQKDLTIECIFDMTNNGSIKFKKKRVDVAIVKPCELTFNGNTSELPIPVVAIECKTNLDKNMISGIEHSVNELKKTFPDCKYFVISELSDFDVKKSNYASSGIDEMYILRNQRRGIIRRRPQDRNALNPILVLEVAHLLQSRIDALNNETVSLEARMTTGKLIGRVL